jgi:hypothetical protein
MKSTSAGSYERCDFLFFSILHIDYDFQISENSFNVKVVYGF